MLISAFNALTLSPALAAMWLRPRTHGRWGGAFFERFNRTFERASNGYVRLSAVLIRKALLAAAILAGFAVLAGGLGRALPTSFVPEEDYGYFLLNVQLPPAASLQRTDAVARKVEAIMAKTPGISGYNAIVGFSVATRVTAPNNAFFFVGLEPWHERELGARAIVNQLNARFRAEIPEGVAIANMPPAIPGLGSQGGFSFWLQDRSGGDIATLDTALQQFLAAARQRPELAAVNSQFSASVPQAFVDVDRDKVLKEGIALPDVYQTLQTFLGGLYVNQFNRFGRQWRVFLQAEGQERTSPESISQFYVRNNDGQMVPMSSLQTTRPTFGPQYTNRFNVYRAAQITGAAAPGYSSGQALDALEEVARGHAAARHQLRLGRPLVPGAPRLRTRAAAVRAVGRVRVPDPGRALRELDAAVLGAAVGAGRGGRRLHRTAAARLRLRRLRPGRDRDADRPGGEERDPDRRVRQGPP